MAKSKGITNVSTPKGKEYPFTLLNGPMPDSLPGLWTMDEDDGKEHFYRFYGGRFVEVQCPTRTEKEFEAQQTQNLTR